ncbi:MAG TPA: hypothetical protein VHC22_19330 [Pirellulales bacterium]|nr:hypothetical protein [Pirellulales bacterium]
MTDDTIWKPTAACLLATVLLCPFSSFAERLTALSPSTTGHAWNPALSRDINTSQSQSLTRTPDVPKEQPSTETTPVDIVVLGNEYKVPRNYIVTMFNWNATVQKDGLPTLRVTFPDFQPLNPHTRACLLSTASIRPPGCMSIDFRLTGYLSRNLHKAAAKLTKVIKHSRDSNGIKDGPYDYKYEEIPISATASYRTYFKPAGNTLSFFNCFVADAPTKGRAVTSRCTKQLLTSRGAGVEYSFNLDMIKDIDAIDTGLSTLADTFVIKGEAP